MRNGLQGHTSKQIRRMIKASIVFACLAALPSCRSEVRADKRSYCVNSSENLCVLPYQALFADRELFVGERVSVSGILRGEESFFTLYQSEDFGSYGIKEGAIHLRGDGYLQQLSSLNNARVIVNGVVRSSEEYWLELRLDSPPIEVPRAIGTFESAPSPPPDPAATST